MTSCRFTLDNPMAFITNCNEIEQHFTTNGYRLGGVPALPPQGRNLRKLRAHA